MKSAYYEILDIPVSVRSDSWEILSALDKIYGFFKKESNGRSPLLELIVYVKNGDLSDLNNFQIYAVTPDSFDGWDLTSAISCGRSMLNRYIFKLKSPPEGIKLKKGKRLFEIKTRVTEGGKRFGWLMQLNFHVYLFVVDRLKTRFHYFVHGGALVWKDRGLLITGGSGSGKSTLTLALAKAGFDFLTDETVAVNTDNWQLFPFPMPPSFDESGMGLFKEIEEGFREDREELKIKSHKCFVNFNHTDINVIDKPIMADVIIFPKYVPDRRPEIRRLPEPEAIERLEGNAGIFIPPETQSVSIKEIAEGLVQNAECYELVSNQLDKTIALVKDVVLKS